MPILTEEEWLGRTVAERYRLDGILSAGGMGILFRGVDLVTGERVAVKMLKPAFALDRQRVARFLRETRIAASLRSEHVAEVRAILQDASEVPFLIMELLEGRTLEEQLEVCGTLSLEETLAIVFPVASALAAAHRAGIVHRDVKPANIFLCGSASGKERVKLLDFGIAKDDDDDFETQTGAVLGTPSYMAPEQAQHGDSGTYTDVWGLGAVMYRCLSGRPPHSGDSAREVLGKVLREPVAPLAAPGVSRLVCAVIDRALAREPHRRYSDVEALIEALRSAKCRAETAVAEGTTLETLAIQTTRTNLEAERELEGATSSGTWGAPVRSYRSIGFVVLGAALAASVMALIRPPPSADATSAAERQQYVAAALPAASSARVISLPAPTPAISSAPAAPSARAIVPTRKPLRTRPFQASATPKSPPASSARTSAPARVERDPNSGLVVVTEW